MSQAEAAKWEQRYRDGSYSGRAKPSAFVVDWAQRIGPGRALDLACGRGRHALHLAGLGFEVDAVDIAAAALEQGQTAAEAAGVRVNWIQADLDDFLPAQNRYRLICVVRYINRELMRRCAAALAPGGYLLCEQHLRTTRPVEVGPGNPDYRLPPNDPLSWQLGLRWLDYREGLVTEADGRTAALIRFAAAKPPLGF